MKIIIFLSLITLSLALSAKYPELFNFGLTEEVCVDKISKSLPQKCERYEENCKDCYDKKYLTDCVFSCKKSSSFNFTQVCKKGCYDIKEKCDECMKIKEECDCPAPTYGLRANDGTSKCVLYECPDKYYRAPDSLCSTCKICDQECAQCKGVSSKCQKCEPGYCLLEQNKCADPKKYICPNNEYKYFGENVCPTCLPKCPNGMYSNEKECKNCPIGCNSCSSPSNCDGCKDGFCLYKNQCVSPDFKCEPGTFKKFHQNDQCFDCGLCQNCNDNEFCNEIENKCDPICEKPKFIYLKKCLDTCPVLSSSSIISEIKSLEIGLYDASSQGWFSNNQIKVTSCDGQPIIGGFYGFENDTYLEKTFTNLPVHETIDFKGMLFLIDSNTWIHENGNYEFQILIDNVLAYKRTITSQDNQNTGINYKQQSCGNINQTYEIIVINEKITHTNPFATIKIASTLKHQPDFWGINDFQIILSGKAQQSFLIYNMPDKANECVQCDLCPKHNYCNKDNQSCDVCIGENKFIWNRECIDICPEGFYKYNDICVKECIPGMFGEDSSRKCQPCDQNCKLCAGTATTCIFPCPDTYIFYNNKCVKVCEATQYVSKFEDVVNYYCDPTKEKCICKDCKGNCASCLGPGENDCITCKPNLYLKNGKCIETCNPGDYPDETRKTCDCCHPGCSTCFGPRIDQCQSCDNNHNKVDNTCYPIINNDDEDDKQVTTNIINVFGLASKKQVI